MTPGILNKTRNKVAILLLSVLVSRHQTGKFQMFRDDLFF